MLSVHAHVCNKSILGRQADKGSNRCANILLTVLIKTENTKFRNILNSHHFLVAQSLSCVRLFATPWTAAHQASLPFTISRSLLKLMSIESIAIQPSHPLLSPSPPAFFSASIFPSIRVFSNKLALSIRWPKYWSFCVSISPSNKYDLSQDIE